jgi:hypothetical protein
LSDSKHHLPHGGMPFTKFPWWCTGEWGTKLVPHSTPSTSAQRRVTPLSLHTRIRWWIHGRGPGGWWIHGRGPGEHETRPLMHLTVCDHLLVIKSWKHGDPPHVQDISFATVTRHPTPTKETHRRDSGQYSPRFRSPLTKIHTKFTKTSRKNYIDLLWSREKSPRSSSTFIVTKKTD